MSDTWTMKDGSKIKISEMQTSHIQNCIKMVKRNYTRARNSYVNKLHAMADFFCNGEQAIMELDSLIDYAEDENNELEIDERYGNQISVFQAELRKRETAITQPTSEQPTGEVD